jgi:hypothetical protein
VELWLPLLHTVVEAVSDSRAVTEEEATMLSLGVMLPEVLAEGEEEAEPGRVIEDEAQTVKNWLTEACVENEGALEMEAEYASVAENMAVAETVALW